MHRLIGSCNGPNNAQTYCERARDTRGRGGQGGEKRRGTQRIEPSGRGVRRGRARPRQRKRERDRERKMEKRKREREEKERRVRETEAESRY